MAHLEHGEKMPRSLYGAAPFSSLIKYGPDKLPYVVEKIDTPIDEFGFPRRVELMRQVLNTMEVAYLWDGGHNTHHVSWHKNDYVDRFYIGDSDIGLSYRECETQKVRIPSQLHAYIHAITKPPTPPPVEFMHQYHIEYGQVESLNAIISLNSFQFGSEKALLSPEEQDEIRLARFKRKLEAMSDPLIGIMPDKDQLYEMEIEFARQVLSCIVGRQGFTNERSTKIEFFKLAA